MSLVYVEFIFHLLRVSQVVSMMVDLTDMSANVKQTDLLTVPSNRADCNWDG